MKRHIKRRDNGSLQIPRGDLAQEAERCSAFLATRKVILTVGTAEGNLAAICKDRKLILAYILLKQSVGISPRQKDPKSCSPNQNWQGTQTRLQGQAGNSTLKSTIYQLSSQCKRSNLRLFFIEESRHSTYFYLLHQLYRAMLFTVAPFVVVAARDPTTRALSTANQRTRVLTSSSSSEILEVSLRSALAETATI